jgi:sulfopyruvate decarboxylase subunit alpha
MGQPMRESTIRTILDALKEARIELCCYLPDGWLAPVERALAVDPAFQVVNVTNEGEGVAMCAGSWLGGRGAVMLMENSGIRVACEELARLGLGQGIPAFMLMPYRGDLGDVPTWAQPHGWTMEPVMQALRMTYRIVRTEPELRQAILAAPTTLAGAKNHVAVVLGIELCAGEAYA